MVGLGYIMQVINLVSNYIIRATMPIDDIAALGASEPMGSSSSGLTALRAFRVLRVLKTMSIVPGLRSIVQALLHSIQALKESVIFKTKIIKYKKIKAHFSLV